MYYRLQPYCTLIEGSARGAIYNFQTGKVYSISKNAVKLLKACTTNKAENIFSLKNTKVVSYLDNLSQNGLGSFYLTKPNFTEYEPLPVPEPKLDFLWLELTSACNNKCLHCYSTSGPVQTSPPKVVSHEHWLNLIHEAADAGATAIQFIGGEPLLYHNWKDLILKARNDNFEYIEIFTNGTLITDNDIDFFRANNISIATTIYAANADVHDTITQNKGSFEKTMTAIQKILSANIPLRIASIIMRANEHEVDNIMTLLNTLGVEVNPPDVVRPTGRGDDADLLPIEYAKQPIKPPFHTDEQSFSLKLKYNSCLSGKIAVTSEGDVIPCIFARNQICGNILNSSLKQILESDALKSCWETNKDKIAKCKDCEYRYACNDCRPLAQGSDPEKDWYACPKDCLYNPYTGIWSDEKQLKKSP